MLGVLLDLLAPPCCPACRAPAYPALCPPCRVALPWLPAARCPRCALPAHESGGRCPARHAAFVASWSPLAHAGPARQVVAALKFHGALGLADLMAAQIAANAPPALLAGAVLVPVPMPAGRRRRRGFDHAERLARALARRTGRSLDPCLRRTGPASRQLGAGRRARLGAGRLAVVARGPVPVSAVLVDDVHTTGATLDACARALRAAGCRRVACVTYTRALAD